MIHSLSSHVIKYTFSGCICRWFCVSWLPVILRVFAFHCGSIINRSYGHSICVFYGDIGTVQTSHVRYGTISVLGCGWRFHSLAGLLHSWLEKSFTCLFPSSVDNLLLLEVCIIQNNWNRFDFLVRVKFEPDSNSSHESSSNLTRSIAQFRFIA